MTPSLPAHSLRSTRWDSISILPLGFGLSLLCLHTMTRLRQASSHISRTYSWNTLEDSSLGGTG